MEGVHASSRISWSVPLITCISYIFGVTFATAHHLFYSHLSGHEVPQDTYSALNLDISKQQVNLAAGTVFAALFKVVLGTALSTAYVQILWRSIKHHSQHLTVGKIDDVAAVIDSAFPLFKLQTWIRFPVLFSVAVLLWFLPLASIVPPATLSIRTLKLKPIVAPHQVPGIDFASLNLANSPLRGTLQSVMTDFVLMIPYLYQGPRSNIISMARSVASSGLPTLPQPLMGGSQNLSWSMAFSGPTLLCDFVDAAVSQTLLNNLNPFMGNTGLEFISWSSGFGYSANAMACNGSLALPIRSVQWQNSSEPDLTLAESCYDRLNEADVTLYMAVAPGDTKKAEIVQCTLANSTYGTNFEVTNGQTSVNYSTDMIDNTPMKGIYAVNYNYDMSNASELACLIISGPDMAAKPQYSPCLSPEMILRQLSYQAIVDAFSEVFTGYIISRSGDPNITGTPSSVRETIIGQIPEMLSQEIQDEGFYDQPFTSVLQNSTRTVLSGIEPQTIEWNNTTLPRAIETLFKTLVISLLSVPEVQPNISSPFAPPPVNVTTENLGAVYVYSASKLWASYGAALFLTAIAIGVGACALVKNQASYSLSFSTFLRVMRNTEVSVEVQDNDSYGEDPLPSYIANAKIRFGDRTPIQRSAYSTELRPGDKRSTESFALTSKTLRRDHSPT